MHLTIDSHGRDWGVLEDKKSSNHEIAQGLGDYVHFCGRRKLFRSGLDRKSFGLKLTDLRMNDLDIGSVGFTLSQQILSRKPLWLKNSWIEGAEKND